MAGEDHAIARMQQQVDLWTPASPNAAQSGQQENRWARIKVSENLAGGGILGGRLMDRGCRGHGRRP
jgi:hypothetical protein